MIDNGDTGICSRQPFCNGETKTARPAGHKGAAPGEIDGIVAHDGFVSCASNQDGAFARMPAGAQQ